MPTKTERILGYLPSTFLPAPPRSTALYAVADAFGNELLLAENSLAALMLAHWIDHADKGAEFIRDLACIAALYGLAPRGAELKGRPQGERASCDDLPADEMVEEFREHLRRYIRTFIEGTVTVQGVLRVTAEALGLRINGEYTGMDTWWKRRSDEVVTFEPGGSDAARKLFGTGEATATGRAVRPAEIVGVVDLSGPVDLRGASVFRFKLDDHQPVDLDLATQTTHIPDPAAATLAHIVAAINNTQGAPLATARDNRYLVLASHTAGSDSRLELHEVAGDAAPRLLGLLPLTYRGTGATQAHVTGTPDLSGAVDLSHARYLRLLVDRSHLTEVDCAGANPQATTLAEIVANINSALGGLTVASHDGHRLSLTSPTVGSAGSIAFQPAAAQDARERLFGPVSTVYAGRDSRPAEVVGSQDLSQGADLSAHSRVRIQVDMRRPITISFESDDPAHASLAQITEALNHVLGAGLARHDGRFIRLSSQVAGPNGAITFYPLPEEEDASGVIFGIGPRTLRGAAATPAILVGSQDLSGGVDLRALHLVRVVLDGGAPVDVDARLGAGTPSSVKLGELTAAVNAQLGADVATSDGKHLVLTAPTPGAASRVALASREVVRRRRFVTRAFLEDEAAYVIFGFIGKRAAGEPGTRASVTGTVDLSDGVDLRETRFLRLKVDGLAAQDIDCAAKSQRPRVALLDEVISAINAVVPGVVTRNNGNLVLTSRTSGTDARITFEPLRIMDALDILIGRAPATFRGRDNTRVNFIGTADLSAGVQLPAGAAVKLRIDAGQPVEISLTGPEPVRMTVSNIVSTINLALTAPLASHDGTHILLTSPLVGANSRIEFAVPAGTDVTRTVFGVTPPRVYQGDDARPATVTGTVDLSNGIELGIARFLRLAADGRPPQDVDCTARADLPAGPTSPVHVTLGQIVAAITDQLGPNAAETDGTFLTLKSSGLGEGASLSLLPHTTPDARRRLLGDVPETTSGSGLTPATITGEADLHALVDLAEHRIIRLAVNGARPVDLDVAGVVPERTSLSEIVEKINRAFPGMASVSEGDHLRLTAPATGEHSTLELLPTRALEVIEYPPQIAEEPPRSVRHGSKWHVNNGGAASTHLKVELRAPSGVAGPALVNHTTGRSIRLMTVIRPGERAVLWRDPETGLRAAVFGVDGEERRLTGSQVLAGPRGAQATVPFAGEWRLPRGLADDSSALLLNNPQARAVVQLQARQTLGYGGPVTVSVTEASLVTSNGDPPAADGSPVSLVGCLRAVDDTYLLVDQAARTLADVRPGPGVAPSRHLDRVVAVYGHLYPGLHAPLIVAGRITDVFDVTLRGPSQTVGDSKPVIELYPRVTIGLGTDARDSLVQQVLSNSSLAFASEIDKAEALTLPLGLSEWAYVDCHGPRFNQSRFDGARYPGKSCLERGIFDLNRFGRTPLDPEDAVFAAGLSGDPTVEVKLEWLDYRPGSFVVNLPADLPEQFGGRFNSARFGKAGDQPEVYAGVVTEPQTDPSYLATLLTEQSSLVEATYHTGPVPLGWDALTIPFRKPRVRTLTGGTDTGHAQMYLVDPDVPGFIKLQARKPGPWGNGILVTVRKAGPAFFDVTIGYQGARFENARQVALGTQIQAQAKQLLKPSPVGILQAKAAGIHADVTRDRTQQPPAQSNAPQPL